MADGMSCALYQVSVGQGKILTRRSAGAPRPNDSSTVVEPKDACWAANTSSYHPPQCRESCLREAALSLLSPARGLLYDLPYSSTELTGQPPSECEKSGPPAESPN